MSHANQDIRAFQDEDEADLVNIWYRSGRATYTYLPGWRSMTLEEAYDVFRKIIRPQNELWVITSCDQMVGYLAINGSYIDRLYIDPSHWRKGWGSRLLDFARTLSPDLLELRTHQENHEACALYIKQGFEVVEYGISPPPESAPDILYRWRPAK